MSTGGELVDVVDEDGRRVRVATRAEVRAENLWHRSVFVALLTRADEVWVHQRAEWKDLWPSRWDVAFGGVVDAGEGELDAAHRELGEEAGVGVDELEDLGAGRHEDDHVREIARVFLGRHDGPLDPADGEVVAVDKVPLRQLGAWVDRHAVVPDSAALVLPRLLTRIDGAAS